MRGVQTNHITDRNTSELCKIQTFTIRQWFTRGKPHAIPAVCLILLALFFFSGNSAVAQDFDHTHRLYDGVARAFVQNGMVYYSGLQADSKALDQYLEELARDSETQFNSWNEPQELAFLINLYNAATLRLILDNYPLKSIKDIGSILKGPWDQPVVRLFGGKITLNTLEHEILRKRYDEPRIHLALVCAARGCPPLRGEAYTAQNLDTQLENQASQFLRNPLKFRIDRQKGVVYLSPIFKWYGADFNNKYTPGAGFPGLNETERAVINFCSRYLGPDDQTYLTGGKYKVKYLDYDWSLNERKESN